MRIIPCKGRFYPVLGLGQAITSFIFSLCLISAAVFSPCFGKDKDSSLEGLLNRSGSYCLRLLSSALDFTCIEEISEIQTVPQDLSNPQAYIPFGTIPKRGSSVRLVIENNDWINDYQLIRRNNVIYERRTMLRENGQSKKIENASLATHRIRYQELIMCPVGLLGLAAQKTHSYRLAGKDKIKGRAVRIIEAKPLPDGPPGLSGRAWVDPVDGSVLKIEWSPESLDQYELIAQLGRRISAAPIVRFISEYGILEKGLRFLSFHKATEAYRTFRGGKIFTRTKLAVSYRDFKFFTVETDVNLQ
jgi:hypothetical protein